MERIATLIASIFATLLFVATGCVIAFRGYMLHVEGASEDAVLFVTLAGFLCFFVAGWLARTATEN